MILFLKVFNFACGYGHALGCHQDLKHARLRKEMLAN